MRAVRPCGGACDREQADYHDRTIDGHVRADGVLPRGRPQARAIGESEDLLPRPIRDGRGSTWGAINAAHALGVGDTGDFAAGGALASRAVAQMPGFPIDHRVAPGFVGFRRAIDAPGGVDVFVARTFTDDRYPNDDTASVAPGYRTARFNVGVQHLDGACAFARSRSAPQDGGDFGHSRWRQQVLVATLDRPCGRDLSP